MTLVTKLWTTSDVGTHGRSCRMSDEAARGQIQQEAQEMEEEGYDPEEDEDDEEDLE